MFNLKRNQIIITVLVFMIAIAAYLNTQELPNSFNTTDVAQTNITESQPEEVDFFSGYEEVSKVDETAQLTDTELLNEASEELTLNDAVDTEKISATITKKSDESMQNVEVAASKNPEVSYVSEEK